MFVRALGFSNGCAEFVPKYPPPFVPSSLMETSGVTGPPATFTVSPYNVMTS